MCLLGLNVIGMCKRIRRTAKRAEDRPSSRRVESVLHLDTRLRRYSMAWGKQGVGLTRRLNSERSARIGGPPVEPHLVILFRMGLTTSLILTSESVADEQLQAWGLAPTQTNGDLWTAFCDPMNQFVAVARPRDWTILLDPEMLIAEHFETDSITLPGIWHVVSTVSSTGFVDYRVFVDGTLVRHMLAGDEELDEGAPVVDESPFTFRENDGADEPVEVDGDLIIQELPRVVGAIGADDDIFDVEGQYFAYQEAAPDVDGNTPAHEEAGTTSGGEEGKNTSIFARLFRKK